MQTLAGIKKDLEFNRGLSSLIEILKSIAVAQYRILEGKIKSYEKLPLSIATFFEFIDLSAVSHPFLKPRNKTQGVVAITSDSGLLGGLNMQVVNQALAVLEEMPGRLIVLGECGKAYVRENKVSFSAFSGIKDEARYSQAMQLRDYCVAKFMEDSLGYLRIVYPHPLSFTVQRVETVSLLPYQLSSDEPAAAKQSLSRIILESSLSDIFEYLIYIWLGQKFYEIFGLSRLAEFAARFVHLEESSQRLKETDKKLQLQYFRIRHELIDRNMRELFSARLLYAS